MHEAKAVVFDLDDTLYPETTFVESGFRHVAQWAATTFSLDYASVHQELTAIRKADEKSHAFNVWLEHRDLPDSYAQEMVTTYREHSPQISLFDGAAEAINDLKAEYRIGLVSDGYLTAQQKKFNALNIADHIEAVVFSDSLGRDAWKPSTKPFKAVLSELGVLAKRAVYVGDNPKKDFLGARRSGMFSIRLRIQGGVYTKLEPESNDFAPDLEVESWEGVSRATRRLVV